MSAPGPPGRPAATDDAIRVLHLTDPHLFADASGALRGTVTLDTLSAVLADIARSGWPADIVSATGDLVQDDSRGAYLRFRDLMQRLGLPIHCIPGNHDVRALMREVLSAAPFHYCRHVVIGNWLIIGLDSCVEGAAGGRVPDAELDRFLRAAATSTAAHALVCLHHPPCSVGSRWLDDVGLADREQFLDALASQGQVRAILFGHAHQEYDDVHAGMRILGTPSTCRQFLPGSDEFALDGTPPAYRRVTLYSDGQIDTEVIRVHIEGQTA